MPNQSSRVLSRQFCGDVHCLGVSTLPPADARTTSGGYNARRDSTRPPPRGAGPPLQRHARDERPLLLQPRPEDLRGGRGSSPAVVVGGVKRHPTPNGVKRLHPKFVDRCGAGVTATVFGCPHVLAFLLPLPIARDGPRSTVGLQHPIGTRLPSRSYRRHAEGLLRAGP